MKFKVTDFRKDPLSEHRIEITFEEVGLFCCCNALFLTEFGLMEKLNTVRKESAKKPTESLLMINGPIYTPIQQL